MYSQRLRETVYGIFINNIKTLRIGAAALNQTALDWEGNLSRTLSAIEAARSAGISLLLTPELCLSGYGCEDAYFYPDTSDRALASLLRIIEASSGIAISVGLPFRHNDRLFNCSALIYNGELLGLVAKAYLAGDGVYYEPRWFQPWPLGTSESVQLWGKNYPLGDLYFNLSGIRIGYEICEDAWVKERRGRGLASIGCDLILNPSASHFALRKFDRRKTLAQYAADELHCAYLLCNTLGVCSGRLIFDGDVIFTTPGNQPHSGERLGFSDFSLSVFDLNLENLRENSSTVKKGTAPKASPREVAISDFAPPQTAVDPENVRSSTWEDNDEHLLFEELSRSIPLGLFDYLRKSGLKGFVLSLSGGADSGSIAVFAYLMVLFAVRQLGAGVFAEKIGLKFEAVAGESEEQLVRRLVGSILLCVYQPTENNSELSRQIATEISRVVGAEFKTLDAQQFEDIYVGAVSKLEEREITWELDDLALQNIQSRVRSPGIWLLANLRGRLLLASSNRSEGSVGYSTMDGDTSGSFNPIGGIDKFTLLRWLKWMSEVGPAGVGPMPELRAVAERAPSAELRPLSEGQTDEKDLMPYRVLNEIERRFLLQRMSPEEIRASLRSANELRDLPPAKLDEWVGSFFRRWRANQWKRERFAPCFQLDEWSIDPKTWCRWPIVSGPLE